MFKWKDKIGQFQFSTLISIAKNDPLAIEKNIPIKKILSSRNPFSFKPSVILADPFLFVQNSYLYLFYEEQIGLNGKGIIKMIKTSDLKEWSKPITVLEESFHLSFPNVFICNSDIYMMPETGFDYSLNLYKPNSNFTKWEHYKTLLKGRKFTDSSIIKFENHYYLFTTDYSSNINILRLYHSDFIEGEWVEHPMSPIASGKNTGRCAGSVFYHNNYIYRPCQLMQSRYGEGIELYQITVLNKVFYEEVFVKTLIPNTCKFYKEGGHHINICEFKDHIVVATDIFEIKFNFIEFIKRIFNKIITLI